MKVRKMYIGNMVSMVRAVRIICIAIGCVCATSSGLYAQQESDLEKISRSQGAASSLLFKVDNSAVPVIQPGNYANDRECTVRAGLPHFFAKLDGRKAVTVAFIGGSITQGNYCYRLQTARYLENLYPDTKFTWVNAGVSGTGTDLGAFRLQEQVLNYRPDLIFIEFAVNGAYRPGMEGIIRQILKDNPHTDICLLYTIITSQGTVYQRDSIPENIQGLETLASYYHLPSIHLAMEATFLEKKGQLMWKGNESAAEASGKILFSKDGIHPIEAGGNLYAAAIIRSIKKMGAEKGKKARKGVGRAKEAAVSPKPVKLSLSRSLSLPQPLTSDSWTAAGMYEPSAIASFDPAWKKLHTDSSHLKQFTGWFPTLMTANHPGASCSFSFNGDLFGLFDIGGPEAGQLEIWVDGKRVGLQKVAENGLSYYRAIDAGAGAGAGAGVEVDVEVDVDSGADAKNTSSLLNRFNSFCNNRYRGQYDIIKVTPGTHRVTFKVSRNKADKKQILGPKQAQDITLNPGKYDQTVVYIGRILLRGKPIFNEEQSK